MQVLAVSKPSPAKVQICTDKGNWQFTGIKSDIIRCTYTFDEPSDETLLVEPEVLGGENLWVSENEEAVIIQTSRLQAVWNRRSSHICWKNAITGELILQEKGHEITACDVMRSELDGPEPIIERVRTIDGERNFVKNLRQVVDHQAYRAKVYYQWQEDEALYGLGQGEEGFYNYRGKTVYLYQHNMRIPMPMLVSSKGYGILMDCGCLMTFQDNEYGSYWFLDTVKQLDYYMIASGNLREVNRGYRYLTGQAVMLPRWAFGFMQSREKYTTDQELLDVAKEYRRRNLPISCVIQDWSSWEKGQWGYKKLDPARYPNMKEVHKELHEMDVHTLISVWCNPSKTCKDYEELKAAGHILLDRSTYNALSEEARSIYWRQAKEGLLDEGFDGWWCDSTEPFTGADWSGAVMKEPWERYQKVGGEHKMYLPAEKANLFAVEHAKGIYENQRKTTEEIRVINLTRSGFASQQKYGAIVWSGDIAASWETLRKQIAEGLNMSMSGMPYWTLDVGGFFVVSNEGWQHRGCGGHTNPKPIWFWQGQFDEGTNDPAYRELYTRWIQLGAFLPIMRSHGTDYPREIWQFGEEGEKHYDAIAKAIRLRYQLMPYVYSVAAAVVEQGDNMMESLISAFPDDAACKILSDQYMFGPSLMVCPVLQASEYAPYGVEATGGWKRLCYLPAGTNWRDFWTHKEYEGGQWIMADAPLDQIPLFVKCGGIIPMAHDLLADSDAVHEICVYPGADGEFTLYQDAGNGYGYEKGECAHTKLSWCDKTGELTIGQTLGQYPGQQALSNIKITICGGQNNGRD